LVKREKGATGGRLAHVQGDIGKRRRHAGIATATATMVIIGTHFCIVYWLRKKINDSKREKRISA
jgi:hypothetical protein